MTIVCACAFRKLIDENVLRRYIALLESKGESFELVDDLCRIAAKDETRMRDFSGCNLAACHQRAIRGLFDRSGVQLGDCINLRDIVEEHEELDLSTLQPDNDRALPEPEGDWSPWYPIIDRERCVSCQKCVSYCLFGVYTMKDNQVQVVSPSNCKDNCPACARVCPEKAIIFPKYDKSPINGGLTDDDPTMGIDMRELYKDDDLYKKLVARNQSRMRLRRNENK